MRRNDEGIAKKVKEISTIGIEPNFPIKIRELPESPQPDGFYVFDNIARKDVTDFNHGLHKYPAKFIPQIPRWGLAYKNGSLNEVILDPFCGSGTTLVEAAIEGKYAIGYDISPLAVLISQSKTVALLEPISKAEQISSEVVNRASKIAPKLLSHLVEGEESLGLHRTWSFWFRSHEMARLLALREAIEVLYEERKPELKVFLLACLSAIAKASSYLNEDQVKVRYDATKQPLDPFISFAAFAVKAIQTQCYLGQFFKRSKSRVKVEVASAINLPLENASVDRVITSPPYINAIDYTMAHKYNLFILGLIQPKNFKDHCRDYIGLTERAVRSTDLTRMPCTKIKVVDEQVSKLWALDTAVSRNRAFIIAQYFKGMYDALSEVSRVVKPGGKAIFVVGSTNRICGQVIETASILEKLANLIGLATELKFYHQLANRSSLRLNRASTGGKVQSETIYVFQRP